VVVGSPKEDLSDGGQNNDGLVHVVPYPRLGWTAWTWNQ